MKLDFLSTVIEFDNFKLVALKTFAQWFRYDPSVVWKWVKKRKLPAFKFKKYIYIILPKKSLDKVNLKNNVVKLDLPSGKSIQSVNWNQVVNSDIFPVAVSDFFSDINKYLISVPIGPQKELNENKASFTFVNIRYNPGENYTGSSFSSPLIPKLPSIITPRNLGPFPGVLAYKYGYYIIYDPNRMSTFNPGTGTLKSTTQPSAFFELCRLLDAAEQSRNGANPGLPPQRNLSTTVSFDTGTISATATIPINQVLDTSGIPKIEIVNYLGSAYTAFDNTGSDLKSSNIIAAFLEMAGLLAAGEKLVQPTTAQPNNIQITYDIEGGNASVTANLPFNTVGAANGDVTIHAIDYL